MLSVIEPLFGLHSLKKYGIDMAREEFLRTMMLLLYSATLYTFPFEPSERRIICVHECLLYNNLASDLTKNMTEKRVKRFHNAKFSTPYDFFEKNVVHECKDYHGVGVDYVLEKKAELIQNICPSSEISRQMYLSLLLIAGFVLWGLFQGLWISASREGILTLEKVRQLLENYEICVNCREKLLVDGKVVVTECTICSAKVQQDNENLVKVKKFAPYLPCMAFYYLLQNIANVIVCVSIVFLLVNFDVNFETWFKCDVPSEHALLIETDPHFNLSQIRCLNPDAATLQGSLFLIIGILTTVGTFCARCCFTFKNIPLDLCLSSIK